MLKKTATELAAGKVALLDCGHAQTNDPMICRDGRCICGPCAFALIEREQGTAMAEEWKASFSSFRPRDRFARGQHRGEKLIEAKSTAKSCACPTPPKKADPFDLSTWNPLALALSATEVAEVQKITGGNVGTTNLILRDRRLAEQRARLSATAPKIPRAAALQAPAPDAALERRIRGQYEMAACAMFRDPKARTTWINESTKNTLARVTAGTGQNGGSGTGKGNGR